MKLLKQCPFWICLGFGLLLFVVTFPFYHDMYIPEIFTGLCICLNALSTILFTIFLFYLWEKKLDADSRTIFLWFTIMQAIGHGIFSIMNWGSWLFLGLSLIVLIILMCSYFKTKRG